MRARLGLLVCAALLSGCPFNVIVINLDDARSDGIDLMPAVQSRLVPRSAVFTNSFAPDPLCCPSRASLLSGLRIVNHHVLTLAGPLGGADRFRVFGGDQATIATWFRAKGYLATLVGKYLNGYDLGTEDPEHDGLIYVPPGWSAWRAVMSPEFYGGKLDGDYRLAFEDGTQVLMNDHTTDEQYQTDVGGQLVVQAILDAVAAQKKFIVYWAPSAPHAGRNLIPSPAERHLGAMNLLAPFRPDNFFEIDRTDKPLHMQLTQPVGFDPGYTDLQRRRQYETLLAVDEQIAAILDTLEATPGRNAARLLDETLIVLTSDNGVTWGQNGITSLGKGCPYESCQRVPLVIKKPSGSTAQVFQETALTYDIAPTILELASQPVPPGLDGRSLAPLLRGNPPVQPWRTDYLMEFVPWQTPLPPDSIPGYVGVNDVANRFKYVEYDTGEVELYDLNVDPGEMESKCRRVQEVPSCDPAYVAKQAELAARLVELAQ